MGLGLPAAVRRETLSRWGALLDAPPSDASHNYVDVPAMLRKTVPQQALLPVKWGANKMATAYLGGDSTRYCFFAFDTPANHHALRARVAVKRSPMATQAQLAAYAAGKLPKQVLIGGRLFLRGAEPYPPGESDKWTTSTPVCLARAMATPRDKLRYYTLFYQALCDRACEAQGPLQIDIDGPAPDADVVVIRCAPLGPDGRSAVTRHHRPRDVRYGEADLKVPRRLPACQPARRLPHTNRPPARPQVQYAVCHPSSGISCNTGLVFSVDTDMVAQMLLSTERLRTLGIRVVLVFPAHTKGGEREIVDCGRFPPGGAETLCFAMLVYGCDYSSSALGFGFDPTRVLYSSSFYAAFSITQDRLTVRAPSLAGFLAQLKDPKKKPRKVRPSLLLGPRPL